MAKQAFAAWETGTEAPAPLTYASGRTQYKAGLKQGRQKEQSFSTVSRRNPFAVVFPLILLCIELSSSCAQGETDLFKHKNLFILREAN